MRKLVVLFFILLFLCACKTTKIVEVPVETIRTEYKNNIVYDSVYIRDSVERWVQGDTVYLYKYHTLYKYKDRRDTVIVTDTITKVVTVDVIQEVKVNEIYWWQKTLMWLGGVLSLIVLMIVIRKFK